MNQHAGTLLGTQAWTTGPHTPGLWPEMVDDLSNLSRMRPSPCIPCDPEHLVSRAVGWRAGRRAPGPSPNAGVHPSCAPRCCRDCSVHTVAEQLHAWPEGPVRRSTSVQVLSCTWGTEGRGAARGGSPSGPASEEGCSPCARLGMGPWERAGLRELRKHCVLPCQKCSFSCPALPCPF